MALWTSDSDPARSTTTLSKDPVATRVRRKPSESISTAAKTNTTNAMPAAVKKRRKPPGQEVTVAVGEGNGH